MERKVFSLPTKRIIVISFLFCLGMEVASFFIDLAIMSKLYFVLMFIGFATELFVICLRFDPGFNGFESVKEVVASTLTCFIRSLNSPTSLGAIYLFVILINVFNVFICMVLPVPFLFYLSMIAALFVPERVFTKIASKVLFLFEMTIIVSTIAMCAYHFSGGIIFHEFVVWLQSTDLFKVYKMLPAGKN